MTQKPRFTHHIGLEFEERPAAGKSRCTLAVQDIHFNSTGVVHGGVHYAMADTAMGASVFSLLEPGQICATVEIKMAYFKPVFGGQIVCTGEVVNKGKTLASTEALLHVDGVLVGKASGTFAIFMRKTDASLAG